MKKKIKLKDILEGFDKYNCISEAQLSDIIPAMKEACRQVIELAAENATIDWIENNKKLTSDSDYSFRDNDGIWCKINISEESILNTINQIE